MPRTRGAKGRTKGKGLIRALARQGTRAEKSPPAPRKVRQTPGPTVCRKCGATFANKTWRRDRRVTMSFLDRADWVECPACEQAGRAEGFGKVILRGAYVAAHEEAIRRRIQNVADRAEFTQPLRRIASIARDRRGGLEVITTSQKLAHRIARELKKAFQGRASYTWSDRDGSLLATWERDDVPAPKPARRKRRARA
jgi:NMD protein affecting ribosome stability and mRNA decay